MEPTCGPYQLLEQLGEGGAGVVYRARDLRDGQEVALKLLLRPTAKRMGRFQLEAATLVKLRHPNVVPVRDFGTAADGRPYLALELIRGQTLQRRLDTTGPLGPTEAVELTLQLAAALSAAHAKGLLHRDVKPENVLIRASDGAAILGDFGLAKELESQVERLTQTGTIMGTPGYLAPEQLGPSQLHTPALDVYGLGATLYAMLTGAPPVTGSTPLEAFQATIAQAPTPPSQFALVSPALEALCLRCLAKDPAERYPDASALLDALDALDSQRPAPPSRRSSLLLLLIGFVAIGGMLGWTLSSTDEIPATQSRPATSSPRATSAPFASEPPTLTAAASPTQLAPSELEDLLARCDRALSLHDPGAGELVREAHRLAPEHARAQLYLGVLLARERKAAEAFDHLSRAIKLDPSLAAPYSLRAQILIDRGDLPAARRDVERALELDSKSHEAWAILGKVRASESDFEGARTAFTTAIGIFPGPMHFADRAALYIGTRKHDLARADADRAVEIGPELAHPWTVRGDLKRALSDPTCLEDYNRALRIDPNHLGALLSRTNNLLELFRYEEALRDATRLLALAPDPRAPRGQRARFDRAVGHLFLGDSEAALLDIITLQRALPNDPKTAFLRAEAHFRLGDLAEAVKWGQVTLKLRKAALANSAIPRSEIPGLSRSLAKLALAQHLQGDHQGSLLSLRRSIKAAVPRDPYPRLWATALSGDLKYVRTWPDPDPWPRPIREFLVGRISQAELLKAATAKSPRAICQVRTFFGVVAERRGDLSQARAHYRAAIETGLRHLDEYGWSELRLR